MAELFFKVGADWENVKRLRDEIKRLEQQLKDFGKNVPDAEIKALEDRLANARKELTKTAKEAAKAGGDITDSLKKWGGAAIGMAGLKEFASQIVRIRGEFQEMETSIETLVGKDMSDKLIPQLKELAKVSPLTMTDLVGAEKTMLGFNIQADKTIRFLSALSDVSMGSSQKFNSLTLAFSQMSATGKLMGQDLNQMINAGFNPLQQISQTTGKSIAQLKEEMSKGAVTAEMVQQAFIDATSAGGKFYKMSENASKTINGQISMMEDAMDAAFNEMGQASEGFIVKSIEMTTSLIENYETIGKVIGVVAATYGTYKAALLTTIATEKVAAMSKLASIQHTTLLNIATKSLTKSMTALNLVTKANPWVLLATVVLGAATAMWAFHDSSSEAEKAQKRLTKRREEEQQALQEHAQKIDELIEKSRDIALADLQRGESLAELRKEYPKIFEKYDIETIKLADILKLKQQINEEDAKRAGEKKSQELKDINNRIAALEFAKSSGNPINNAELRQLKADRDAILKENGKGVSETFISNLKKADEKQLDNYIAQLEKRIKGKGNEGEVKMKLPIDIQGNLSEEAIYSVKEIKNLIDTVKSTKETLSKKTTYKDDYEKAKKEWETAKKELAKIEKNKGKYTTKQYEDAKKREEAAEAAYKKVGGKTDKQLEREEKEADKRKKQEEKKANEILSMRRNNQQEEINLLEEGAEKRRKQIELDYTKEIDAIEKQEREWKLEQDGKTNAEQDSILNAQRLLAEQKKNKALNDIRKEELQSMRDYLMEYGTLEQQRLAIAEEYAEKIVKAQTEGEKASLRVQQAQAEKDIQQKAFDKSFDWSAIFQDLQGHTVEYLTSLRDQLQDVLKNGGLDPEQMAIAQEKLRELNDEISRSGGIFDFVGSRQREQNRREQEAKDAKDALTAAQIEQGGLEMRLSQAKLLGAPTNKILALEKQLADAREKTAKAATKAKEAEDSASRNAAQAVADWFGDAQQFIAEKGIDQLPELLNSIGLGSLGEKAAQGLSGFNNAAGAAADFASGNYIGAALKGINAVKDFGRMFGVGGGNAAEVQATIDRLTDRNELLTRAIEDLTEELEVNRGAMTMQAAQEAMRYQEEKNQNLKEIAQAQAGYHNAHHSWNSYWNGFSNEFVKEFSKRIGRSWSGDIWELTADEMDKLLSDPYAAELIKGTGKGGYGERVYEKLEDYAAEAEAIEEITKQLNEAMTGMSFDGFYNSFIDNLMDMEKSAEDIFDDMAEYYQRAMLSRAVGEKMYEDLEKWYDKYAEAAKSGEGLTSEEIDALNREYQNLINEGIRKRDEIAKITGYGDTFKDAESAAARGIENITQDQANALEGIMTAQQIALEQGNAIKRNDSTTLSMMNIKMEDIVRMSAETYNAIDGISDILANSYLELQGINNNTKPIKSMGEDLADIKRIIKDNYS